MPQTGKLGIAIEVDDGQLKKLLETIATLSSSLGGSTAKVFQAIQSASKSTAEQIQSTAKDTSANVAAIADARADKEIAAQERATAKAEQARQREEAAAAKAAAKEEALAAQAAAKEEALLKQKEAAETNANKLIAERAEQYAKLKAEYEGRSLDDVRQKIHQFEQDTRVLRNARAQAEDQATKKEIQERTNAVNTQLQLYRSLEKEKIGRTFSEQIERLNLEQKSDKDIKAILEKQKEEFKEIQQQMTITQDAEEKKRLAADLATLKAETAAVKKEAEERGIEEKKAAEGAKKEKGGGGLGGKLLEGGAIAAGIEGFKMLKEHADEAAAATKALQAGTGLTGKALEQTGKQAEALGDKYALSGEAVKTAMGKIASYSGASGDKLKQMTEDAVILAQSTGQDIDTVAKSMGKATDAEVAANMSKVGVQLDVTMSAEQRAAKIHEEAMKRKAAVDAANATGSANMERIMNKVTETIGTLAETVLNALSPALSAVMPVISTLGGLIGDTLKPILDALTPVITLISDAIKQLAPPIVDLVKSALGVLTPILGEAASLLKELIPPIIDIVKTVMGSLTPVFASLSPIVKDLAGMLGGELGAVLKDMVIPILQALMPILTDLLVPVLTALMPLIKLITGLLNSLLVPIFNTLGTTIKWVIDNAIQPLIKWISGFLGDALKGITKTITAVVGAISSIVGAVKGVLGLGGDAKDAVTQTAAQVGDAQDKANADAKQKSLDFGKDEIANLRLKIQNKTLTVAEANEAEKRAQEVHNGAVLAMLNTFQKQHASDTAKGAKSAHQAAAKEAKDFYAASKADLDNALTEQKDVIETANQTNKITDREAKDKLLAAQKDHDDKLIALVEDLHDKHKMADLQYNNTIKGLKRAAQKDEGAINKQNQADQLADLKEAGDKKIAELELQAAKENMTASMLAVQKSIIERKNLADEIAMRKSHGEDVSKLQLQLDTLEANATLNAQKTRIALKKAELAEERNLDKDKLAALQQHIQQMQTLGQGTLTEEREAREEATTVAEQEEADRYAQELEQRRDELDEQARLAIGDIEGAKKIHQIKEELEQEHTNKLKAIKAGAELQDEQAFQKEKQAAITQMQQLSQIFSVGKDGKLKILQDYAQKTLGIEGAQYLGQQNGLKQFLAAQGAQIGVSLAGQLAAFVSTEYQKTAATNAGFLSRSLTVAKEVALGAWALAQKIAQTTASIAQDVAKAAASAFTATVSAVKWVAETVPFPLDLAIIPLAIAGIYEAYQGAKHLFKFADGALLTGPTSFSFAGGHQGLGGEAGHEAVIPLNQYPGMKHLMDGGFEKAMAPLIQGIQQVHQAVQTSNHTFAQRPAPSILNGYATNLSIRQDTVLMNQRKLGR